MLGDSGGREYVASPIPCHMHKRQFAIKSINSSPTRNPLVAGSDIGIKKLPIDELQLQGDHNRPQAAPLLSASTWATYEHLRRVEYTEHDLGWTGEFRRQSRADTASRRAMGRKLATRSSVRGDGAIVTLTARRSRPSARTLDQIIGIADIIRAADT